jgi:hypothetical protein
VIAVAALERRLHGVHRFVKLRVIGDALRV